MMDGLTRLRPHIQQRLCVLFIACCSMGVNSLDFGIADSRAMGMGGAVVATGTPQHAQFYNAALLAFHDREEEESRDGRFFFPNVTVQVSKDIEQRAEDLENELDLLEAQDDLLTEAINTFNAEPSAENADAVVGIAQDLDAQIEALGDELLTADSFIGFSLSEPSKREGGSFYIGMRVVGDGTSKITQEDLALVDDYIEAMDFIASGGARGEQHLELFDENGDLIDPRDRLSSSAGISALAITEWGVAVAKEFPVFGKPIAFGVTPKVMRIDAYGDELTFDDANIAFEDSKKTYYALNVDLGIAAEIGEHFRVGLAMKDAISDKFKTDGDVEIELKSRTRVGLGYVNRFLSVGLDYDLSTNKMLASDLETQEAALGIELRPFSNWDFRLGYRTDMEGNRESAIISGGIEYRFRDLIVLQAAYQSSDELEGAAFQVGWAF